jgi:lipopolysaccharide transport system ATP-binding protein
MPDVVIAVENLSKRYLLGHQSAQRERNTTLRDVISRQIANFVRNSVDVFRGRQIMQGDEIEEFWALKDVSFKVKPGEVCGIIGRNGAGKTTLLKILSRITEPTEGRVRIAGRVTSLLEVGTGFHPELTGRENIYLNGAILGMTRLEIQKKFDEIVAFAEVEKFLDTPVKRYSSGMYVRLAFAVAAHLEPEILIVDEVLAVGDFEFQSKCLGKMKDVSGSGRTVLFVSHNLSAIQQLCSRAILIRQGRLAQDGVPANIVKEYLADRTRDARTSVRDWPDRTSNGEGRIVSFEVLDELGRPTTSIPLGGAVRFRITAETYRPMQPLFGILVHAPDGEPMLNLRSFHDGLRLDRTMGRIVVQAEVCGIGLYPGEYTLSPWFKDRPNEADVDWVKHCASLYLMPKPGPHGDLMLNPVWGKYHLPSAWSLIEREESSVVAAEPCAKVGDGAKR